MMTTPMMRRLRHSRPVTAKKKQMPELPFHLMPNQIERIVNFAEDEPAETLGPKWFAEEKTVVIHAFLPRAKEAWVRKSGSRQRKKMSLLHPSGFYQAVFPSEKGLFSYLLVYKDERGEWTETQDPYAFSPRITDFDLFLIGEGNHYRSYEILAPQFIENDGVHGVRFAVWAPNAKSVSVIGDFNHWRPGVHPLNRIHFSGVWGVFIPGIKEGVFYKYAIKTPEDHLLVKADPYALHSELRPNTASVTDPLEDYHWRDRAWMEKRKQTDPLHAPVSIYEVHLGSWKRSDKNGGSFLSYRELAHELVSYVKEMGYTHIELMPVMEHPLDESWGYQTVNYYAPTSRFGTPKDFKYFIDTCHRHGIGVILDWVPSHFPKDAHGLTNFDGRQIYAYENWKKGEHKEWGTLVFDYGRKEVRNFLISNALFWIEEYHADGLRVDAVASMLYLDYSRKHGEWEPNPFGGNQNLEAVEFIKHLNETVYAAHPGVMMIAEESTAWPGVSRPTFSNGLGFGFKWNMGWMHDTLDYFSRDPIHRKFHQGTLTFSLIYAFTENFILPISHDEVVYGKRSLLEKMPGDDWQKFANLRLFLSYMYAHPGKKLLFMGQDIAQRTEWNCTQSLDWHLLHYESHRGIQLAVKDLNRIYRDQAALWEADFEPAGFEWIDFSDAESSVLAFVRWSRDRRQMLFIAFNMTPVFRPHYRFGVPQPGVYEEIFNSDAKEYGGGGLGNAKHLTAQQVPWSGREWSMEVNIPPLGAVLFQWRQE